MATQRSSILAAILSIIVPGLGQLYKGSFISGLIWFLLITSLYTIAAFGWVFWILFPIPIGLHLLCVIHAFFMEG